LNFRIFGEQMRLTQRYFIRDLIGQVPPFSPQTHNAFAFGKNFVQERRTGTGRTYNENMAVKLPLRVPAEPEM